MKKILLSVAMLASCVMASAQKLTYVPYTDNAFLAGSAISANGRYVGGGTTEGYAFICDMQTNETKLFIHDDLAAGIDEEATTDIYAITDDGIGYGYIKDAAGKFDFAEGTMEAITTENGIAKWTTSNGSMQFGVTYDNSFTQTPIVWKNGEKMELPLPTNHAVGFYEDENGYPTNEVNGAMANFANADGSVIVGSIVDNMSSYPFVMWNLNADGKTYSVVPVMKRYFNPSYESWQPYDYFEAGAISANGKWVAMTIHNNMWTWDDPDTGNRIARYDVEADTLQLIDCPDADQMTYYYANGIANDGTIVGYVENQMTYGTTAMICQAGSTKAEYMKDVYPNVEALNAMDGLELDAPCAITPDGRYIMGYGYVESPLDSDDVWYATWRLDRGEDYTGVEETVADNAPKKVVASYSMDGKKLNAGSRVKGLVVNRLSNGKAVKNVVK